jgi:hypothetical protein
LRLSCMGFYLVSLALIMGLYIQADVSVVST